MKNKFKQLTILTTMILFFALILTGCGSSESESNVKKDAIQGVWKIESVTLKGTEIPAADLAAAKLDKLQINFDGNGICVMDDGENFKSTSEYKIENDKVTFTDGDNTVVEGTLSGDGKLTIQNFAGSQFLMVFTLIE